MLILFIATTFGVGGTLTALDNLGQIGNSLGYPSKSLTTFVSLVSIWNYLGRAVSGFASEIFLTKYKFPCPLMLTQVLLLSLVLATFSQPLVSQTLSTLLQWLLALALVPYGPIMFAIISEISGLKYYSTLYNFGAWQARLDLTYWMWEWPVICMMKRLWSDWRWMDSSWEGLNLLRCTVLLDALFHNHSINIGCLFCLIHFGAKDYKILQTWHVWKVHSGTRGPRDWDGGYHK